MTTRETSVLNLPVSSILEGSNVRRTVSDAGLMSSIRDVGVLSPILVSDTGNGEYMLVCGARRLMAARLIGAKTIPAVVMEGVEESERLWLQISENIQREDLLPLEKAEAIRRYKVMTGESTQQIANRLGIGKAAVNEFLAISQGLTGEEKAALAEMTEQPSVSTLAIASRTKPGEARKAMLSGEMPVDQARRARRQDIGLGRLRNFSVLVRTRAAAVSVRFAKRRATKSETVSALAEARDAVRRIGDWPPKPTPPERRKRRR